MDKHLKNIALCLAQEREILSTLLQTPYISWQRKLIHTIIKFCQQHLNRKVTVMDVLKTVESDIPKIYYLSAIGNHLDTSDICTSSYTITTNDLVHIKDVFTIPGKNTFIEDMLDTLKSLEDEVNDNILEHIYIELYKLCLWVNEEKADIIITAYCEWNGKYTKDINYPLNLIPHVQNNNASNYPIQCNSATNYKGYINNGKNIEFQTGYIVPNLLEISADIKISMNSNNGICDLIGSLIGASSGSNSKNVYPSYSKDKCRQTTYSPNQNISITEIAD